jgi:prevent-host-death family protein
MIQVNITEAKAHLFRLLTKVAAGEEVLITRFGKPLARLTAIGDEKPKRELGRDLGLFDVPDDFNARYRRKDLSPSSREVSPRYSNLGLESRQSGSDWPRCQEHSPRSEQTLATSQIPERRPFRCVAIPGHRPG